MHHASLGCRFDPRGYHNLQAWAARMAVGVVTEVRQAGMAAARMAVGVGTEDRLAGMAAVLTAHLLAVGGVEAKVATKAGVLRAVVGKVAKVACSAVFQEILHCSFLHKVCDTRQLGVSRCWAGT